MPIRPAPILEKKVKEIQEEIQALIGKKRGWTENAVYRACRREYEKIYRKRKDSDASAKTGKPSSYYDSLDEA